MVIKQITFTKTIKSLILYLPSRGQLQGFHPTQPAKTAPSLKLASLLCTSTIGLKNVEKSLHPAAAKRPAQLKTNIADGGSRKEGF